MFKAPDACIGDVTLEQFLRPKVSDAPVRPAVRKSKVVVYQDDAKAVSKHLISMSSTFSL